jgi:hypothetical protein
MIFWYWFTDMGAIFPTSFEGFVIYLVFMLCSFLISSHALADKFIRDILDKQISFTTTQNL